MNAHKKPQRDIDGLADTAMVSSSGLEFQRTALSDRSFAPKEPSGPRGGTLTDAHHPDSRTGGPARIDDVVRGERYDVVREHARGGLGRILEAWDTRLGRTVAIKELLRATTFAESLFVREALVTARLQHPGIVPVHEAGRWPSGDPYYVMKLVTGRSMQAVIREKKTLQERMALLPNVIAVVEAVAYAHSQDVLHRDIKPANIIVGEFGETVVVDWGLARDDKQPVPPIAVEDGEAPHGDHAQDDSDGRWHVTGNYSISGKVVGTPAYMSPEQARGDDVDERTDVYALGALLYEVLSGAPPYPGARLQQVLERVLAGPPRPLAEVLAENGEAVKADLITIVDKALARDRDGRYASAKELAEELARFQTGQLVSAHQYTTWTLVRRWIQRHRAPLAVALAAALILAVSSVISVQRIVREKNIAETERAQARAAEKATEAKHNTLLFLQAENALDKDPTATLAWLERAPLDGEYLATARKLYDQAVARGVARHVSRGVLPLISVAMTPDGRRALAGDKSGAVRAFDIETGADEVIGKVESEPSMIAVSPDSTLAAVGTAHGTVTLLPLDQGPEPRQPISLPEHQGQVLRIAFSSDGRRLLSSARGESTRIWDIESRALVREFEHTADVAFTADFKRIAVTAGDGGRDIALVDTDQGGEPVRFHVPHAIREIQMSGDGRYLATFDGGGEIHLIDTQSGEVRRTGTNIPFVFLTEYMAFSPDSTWLATVDEDHAIRLWYLPLMTSRLLRGHENHIYSVVFAPDSSFLVSVSDDATAILWDTTSGHHQTFFGHTDDVLRSAIGPKSDILATVSLDDSIRIWAIHPPEELRLRGLDAGYSEARFLDDDTVTGVSTDGEFVRWQLSSQKRQVMDSLGTVEFWARGLSPDGRMALTADKARLGAPVIREVGRQEPRILPWSRGYVRSSAWSTDSSALALLSSDGEAVVAVEGREPAVFKPDPREYCSVGIAAGGNEFALLRPDGVDLMSATDGKRIASLDIGSQMCGGGRGMSPLFSPDGAWLAVAHFQTGLTFWNLRTKEHQTIDTSGLKAHGIQFSNDSTKLVMPREDRSVRIVEVATGAIRELGRHEDLISAALFSPDDRFLATSSYDHTVRLWDLETNDVRVLRGHTAPVLGLDFSEDGSRLLTASSDSTVRVWRMDEDEPRDGATVRALIQGQTTATINPGDLVQSPPAMTRTTSL